ncbi:beta-glucosidase H [Amphiplicatus metriothermophilus]|uniref:Beta-glucosidase n=1 Tax=Amphiplicatus metriothermophilus TaxID=1519374 RepID=A0A239PR58_9PROT|nr:glycoside hydrolase family 3 C-terminal domain-containing protein [Amphiplicatus metriothermophilus]MBB5518426.1 beta-glucosidase [Amphiplicatus metriothermophilus]SNT72412.1 beta-glucosidase [Amphiplicatus metriothermophilus]
MISPTLRRSSAAPRAARWLAAGAALALAAACGERPADTAPSEQSSRASEAQAALAPWRDPSLSPEERAADLVSRLTLEEKVWQMYDKAPAIERLGVPEYNWWNEALHGVARAGEATVFPQAIGLAATWDEDLMLRVATVISDEARAKHHYYLSEDVRAMYGGLTFWSPNINIFRDPRWGRGQETYGEDPFLTGRMAVNFINGMQGDHEKYLKTVATVKHYAVHSGPEPTRHSDDYHPSEADLRETYLPAFKMAFDETGVASVMCAYNAVWGAPACGSERLMVDLLRGELGFDGYVVSDCGAIGDFYYPHAHAYVETRAEAAALAVKMGTDLNCGDGEGNKMDALPEAVEKGLIAEAEIDRAVERLFAARFRLGMFDDPADVPWASIPYSVVASPEHLALSEEAARKSLVLLKNNGVLPLKGGEKVAVIGPNADNKMTLIANYHGVPTAPVTALEGIVEKIGAQNVSYAPGSPLAGDVYAHYEPVGPDVLFHENENGALSPGLKAAYYEDPQRSGEPVLTRIDPNIDFYWHRSPTTNGLNDEFGATWRGYIVPKKDGAYRFKVSRWAEASIDGRPANGETFEMKAGERYALSVDFGLVSGWTRDALEKFVHLEWVDVSRDLRAEAMAAAAEADVILFFGGIDATLEGEEMKVEIDGFLGGDRTHLNLPKPQEDLLKALKATGKPVVLVNFSGSAMALNWADENLDAIVQAFYPGEKAGAAIVDLLWGEFSPSGRLPVTFYRSLDGLPAFDDYSMRNRTYKYYEGEPLYPFGYGLSYTTFAYSDLAAPESHDAGEPMPVSVTVTNTGARAGREVVQVYLQREDRPHPSAPRVELVAFDVAELEPGESRTVSFVLPPERLGFYDEDGAFVTPNGSGAIVSIGGGQPGMTPEGQAASRRVVFAADASDGR